MGTCTQAGDGLCAWLATGIRDLPVMLLNLEAETTHKGEPAEHTRTKPDMVFKIYFFLH